VLPRLVSDAVDGQSGAAVLVYVPHTTAGVTINEHADPAVAHDFETALERIVPSDWSWQHIEEGEENAPTHIRAAFMGPSVVIPLREDGWDKVAQGLTTIEEALRVSVCPAPPRPLGRPASEPPRSPNERSESKPPAPPPRSLSERSESKRPAPPPRPTPRRFR
jgi:hypothetical protein